MGKFRVLVADDSALILKIVNTSLEEIGSFEIVEAHDGVQALNILKDSFTKGPPIDLVLIDWNMPHMTGIEVMKQVAELKSPQTPAFIVVTAEREQKSVTAAFKAGAQDYISKPISHQILKRKIEKVLSRKQAA